MTTVVLDPEVEAADAARGRALSVLRWAPGSERRVPGLGWVEAAGWVLGDRCVGPDQSTGEPVGAWLARVFGKAPAQPSDLFVHVVSSGFAVADLYALAEPCLGGRTVEGPTYTARHAPSRVSLMDMVFPGIGVRDAIGWALTVGAGPAVVLDEVSAWADAGVGPGGWVYAAAGLTIEETVAGLDDASITPERAAMLAALRGSRVPVG